VVRYPEERIYYAIGECREWRLGRGWLVRIRKAGGREQVQQEEVSSTTAAESAGPSSSAQGIEGAVHC